MPSGALADRHELLRADDIQYYRRRRVTNMELHGAEGAFEEAPSYRFRSQKRREKRWAVDL
jgi:hypothetical protein